MTERIRILFVDDDEVILELLSCQLERQRRQWDIDFASGPEEALRIMAQTPADIVITDIRMPDMDGLTLIARMREIAPDATYMILSGTADLPTVINAINEARVHRFFTKPCTRDTLVDGISAAIATLDQRKSTSQVAIVPSERIGLIALNTIPVGIMIADAEGRVRLTNSACDGLLAARDGLSLDAAGICRAATPDATRALHACLKAIASGELDSDLDSQTLALERPSTRRPLAVIVSPLTENTGPTPLVALMIRDPESQVIPDASDLATIFGLSRSEAVIASAIAQGHRLEDAADVAGVTTSTARTYLKHVFAKTGTSRQSELVKLLLAYAVERTRPASV